MSYNKILIEVHHGLGDVVQMIPLINNLRRNFQNAKISVIVASNVHAEILESTNLVDDYYFLNIRKMTCVDIIQFIRDIRKQKYDIAFLSPISNKKLGPILLYILGCKYRVGEISNKSNGLIKNNITVKENTTLHRVDRNLNLLKAANIKIYDPMPFIRINENYKNKSNKWLKRFSPKDNLVGVCIGTNPVYQKKGFKRIPHEVKKWSLENYICLIKKLAKNNNVILLGGKKEEKEIEEFAEEIKDNSRILNFINKTSIMESAALANECDLIIGGDTGMLHIADALGKNTLTIFGPTDPKLVGPYSEKGKNITLNIDCQYCYGSDRLFQCTDRKCLNDITVEHVYNKALEILNNI